MYRPLPDCLTIRDSLIEGLGLFATKAIPAGTELGVTHLILHDNIWRTPLGGFYNNSERPNCFKQKIWDNDLGAWTYVLYTSQDIEAGEELTVKYSLYNPTKKD